MLNNLMLRSVVIIAFLLFCSCKTPELEGALKWEGIFSLPKGDEKAIAQFDFEKNDGILSLPGIIPVPLNLSDVSQKADSVFFTIGFRSGPAPCKAIMKSDTIRGVMTSSRGGSMPFWLAKTGKASTFAGQSKPPANAPVVIKTHAEKPEELAIKKRLEALLDQYDLEPYLYTKEVNIQQGTIPHSHPVLTLSTDFKNSDTYLLSVFLHEQMHWYSLAKEYDQEALANTLFEMYPEVPIKLPEGGGSRMGTYLHILVCYLEYYTLAKVIGEKEALEHMEFMTTQHYTWIFKTIIKDRDKLKALYEKHGLLADL